MHPWLAVEAEEQIPDSLAPAQRQPAPSLMLRPVMNEMAPLAECLQVPRPILGRVMVEVRTGQHHARLIPGEGRGQLSGSWQPPQRSASARPPDLMVLVPPPSIPEMIDQAAVGPPAALASPLRTAEADDGRELGPVDRITPAMLRTDRHLLIPSSGLAEVNHPGICSKRYAQKLRSPAGLRRATEPSGADDQLRRVIPFLAWGRDEAEAESIVARGSGKRHPEPRRYRGAGGMAGF